MTTVRAFVAVAAFAVAAVMSAAPVSANGTDLATRQTARSHDGCQAIYDAFIHWGATPAVAERFAFTIAPRESGCRPQYVRNRTDWSYSRLGLNGLTPGLRRGWLRLCGSDVRSDTADLMTDVGCAMAAYKAMGWRPWRATA